MVNKSVLDGMPLTEVKEDSVRGIMETMAKAMPKGGDGSTRRHEMLLGIVGSCPVCGSPVYGKKLISSLEEPGIRYSCDCRIGIKAFHDSIRTK